jgi:hypothetical protein
MEYPVFSFVRDVTHICSPLTAPVQEKKEVPLTCDWTEYTAGNDKKYYHNKKTNQVPLSAIVD